MTMTKCSFPGRNLCAPSGKISAVFVDLDGTVMKCDPYFEAARLRFGYLMHSLYGFDKDEAIKLAQGLYMANMKRNGVERDQLSLAMVTAYKRLCRRATPRIRPVKEVIGMCEDIGNSPFFRQPELFPNAQPVLNRAHHNFLIIGVTMGNREAQKHKIRMGGLESVFDHYIITPYDNKAERVRELIEDLNIDPEYSAFIGNSTRSDGSCLSETNVVLVPFEKGVFDDENLPTSDRFKVYRVQDWRDAEERVLQRIVVRRDRAVQLQEAEHQHDELKGARCPHCTGGCKKK